MRDKLSENLKQRLWDEHHAEQRNAEDEAREDAPMLASKLAQWIGGTVSLLLVLGVVYWVFELGRRDANEVPVIQALGGVARVQPEESGGPQVDNQGLQVNEVLASDETAPVEPETRLAPPPQRVTPEDVLPEETPPVIENQPTAENVPFTLPASLPGADPNMTRPLRRVGARELPASADLLSSAIADAISTVAAEDAGLAAPVAATTPTLSITPAVPAPASAGISGERMIQLGAYNDEESANKDWEALVAQNTDLMGGLTRFVERREAGGRVFYRLRARGFSSMEEATTMCTALLARSVQCIAVTAR